MTVLIFMASASLANAVTADNGQFTLVETQVGVTATALDKVKDGTVLVFSGNQLMMSWQIARYCDISSIRQISDPQVGGNRVFCIKVSGRENIDYKE
jgi:hypothetical protein